MKRATDVRLRLIIHPTWFTQVCEVPVRIDFKAMNVCMECKREIVNGHAAGPVRPLVKLQSHGACLECLPEIGRKYWGLNQEQIQELIDSEQKRLAA